MEFQRVKIDKTSVLRASGTANHYIRETVNMARNFGIDPKRDERLKAQKCKFCFYRGSRIGGAACSSRPCGLCDTVLHSGNTNVDVLCKECAEREGLCVQCGANINLSERRWKWGSLTLRTSLKIQFIPPEPIYGVTLLPKKEEPEQLEKLKEEADD